MVRELEDASRVERTIIVDLAAAHGAPLFCAAFVFTLQGDPALLPLLLLVAAIAAALGERWRGEGWNDHQVRVLLEANPSAPQNPSATPSSR